MPEPTPEAWAQIRHDYEHTDRQIVDICAAHGITSPMLRYRVKRWGWTKRRSLIPRRGPPPVEVVQQPETAAIHPTPLSESGEGSPHPTSPLRLDVDFSPHSSPDGAHSLAYAGRGNEEIVPRLQSAVARVLPAIEATVARLASGLHPRELEQAGRALSSLTRALRELNALLAEHKADDPAPTPTDIDEFRLELSRRLKGIIEARRAAMGQET